MLTDSFTRVTAIDKRRDGHLRYPPPSCTSGMPIQIAMLNWLGVGIGGNLDLERAVGTARRLNR